jgi:hypothetical protein
MLNRAALVFMAAIFMCAVPVVGLAITPYSQNFEGLTQSDPGALGSDGWLVYGNVFSPSMAYLYGYGPYAAPNHSLAFSTIVLAEGGTEQGAQQLTVFNDYENAGHAAGNFIESNVYREWTIAAADTGQMWFFDFQAKLGNIAGISTAAAFIKTLDPSNGWALTHFVTADMTSIPATWAGYSVHLYVDASLVGQIFQIGFMNTATNYEGSGIFYDNIDLHSLDATGVPDAPMFVGATLQKNFPNPFSPRTRIGFTMEAPGHAELAVFDLAGRRVATLREGEFAEGTFEAAWDGRTHTGVPAAAGQYWYVLSTPNGRIARPMTLLK